MPLRYAAELVVMPAGAVMWPGRIQAELDSKNLKDKVDLRITGMSWIL
ncbi:MAG: hypothetical protein MPEBLZ_03975 [Candidatus Methanoperedens nitroreducens]|uniref:Uncharacterized protein n=1 Tax=Candidatus Methanoperedens nitratireducens TaxID=1392998 RepID=A0A0P8DVE1_9EURY|nr:MAG: hypothetical protein MPEBLZ_03975 [Candidatus Methanoperedens sp. BLZ1]